MAKIESVENIWDENYACIMVGDIRVWFHLILGMTFIKRSKNIIQRSKKFSSMENINDILVYRMDKFHTQV